MATDTDTARMTLLRAETERISAPRDLPVRPDVPPYVSLHEAATVLHLASDDILPTLNAWAVRVRFDGADALVDTADLFALHALRRQIASAEYFYWSEKAGYDGDIDFETLNTRLE